MAGVWSSASELAAAMSGALPAGVVGDVLPLAIHNDHQVSDRLATLLTIGSTREDTEIMMKWARGFLGGEEHA
jgi:hypothetical protein